MKRYQKMKAKRIVIFGLVLTAVAFGHVSADTGVFDRFGEANQLYAAAKYEEAAKVYEEIAKNKPSAEVYFNLGNAYFKSKKLGQAVLNYERARRLNPRDSDVLANLSYVDRLLEYKIDDKRNWFVRKKEELLGRVTINECWLLALFPYFVFVAGFMLALMRKQRPIFDQAGVIALCVVIFCLVPLLLKFSEAGRGRQGIITETQSEVRYGPSTNDRIAFRLVEGLAVSIRDEKQDWYRIQLTDGRSGWISGSHVTPL
ncbi:MAG: tetratricopeptide repeat protein [Candidatus Omnitrophica bacterium]|nr:tetratricopeptide repeat protein [Candidatus Omnitrophota bacterium]